MPGEFHRDARSFIVATQVAAYQPVTYNPGVDNQIVPATPGVEPLGVTIHNGSVGRDVAVQERTSVVRVTAGASLGAGANVGLAVATTSVAPVGSGSYRLGVAQTNAQPGDIFSVQIDPGRV